MKEHYPFVNTPLPYDYASLEPYIDAKTMELHHDRHLQAYIDKLNTALSDQPRLQMLSLDELLAVAPALPEQLCIEVERNAGGVYNHQFFFSCLSAEGGMLQGKLLTLVNNTFGSLDAFMLQYNQAAMSVFGSGYAWLAVASGGGLVIVTTANQETPLTANLFPVLTTDVWEHAYYLKHYNKRADYLTDLTSVINWSQVEQNYYDCLGALVSDTNGYCYIHRS